MHRSTSRRTDELDELWAAARPTGRVVDAAGLGAGSQVARRYLQHALTPGAPWAGAARLTMHGTIKLRTWRRFTAEQVIVWERGMIWKASVRMAGMSIRGFDRFVDGVGVMRWRLLGLVPIVHAAGPDIDRSAAGRLAAETTWLPSTLARDEVTWRDLDASRAEVQVPVAGRRHTMELGVAPTGSLVQLQLDRWGNPDGGAFGDHRFGAMVEDESTFDGVTIPSRLRVGWFIGSDAFEPRGEFFRVTVDHAAFR